MVRRARRLMLVLPVLLGLHAAAAQEVEDLARAASTVVVGIVEGSSSRWDPATRMIVTDTTIRVTQPIKGRAQPTLVVTTPGGVLPENNLALVVPHMPQFADLEEVLLFLEDQAGRLNVVGGAQGKFSVRVDAGTGRKLVGNAALTDVVDRLRRMPSRP